MKNDIGMIGLAVMGENLVLNMESKGFSVSGYDISAERMKEFQEGRAKDKNIYLASSMEDFVLSLSTPRKVMMMIRAGNPVDQVIETLIPLLDEGDIIIDGGNSNYNDTIRRTAYVESHKLLYIGSGVSGGEEGALHGPSIMPGGSEKAWLHVQPLFEAIAAKTAEGDVCVNWVGSDGAGHYVKMVHNGIEYGDIQLIGEAYHIMRDLLNMTPDEMADVFEQWNKVELDSYLIDITAKILRKKDQDGTPLINKILDTAGQKGTGKWTAISALQEGMPVSLIAESVFARCLSAQKSERVIASQQYNNPVKSFTKNKQEFLNKLQDALYVSKIISYAQGFVLLKAASESYNWNLQYGDISILWKEGCIIRSVFLNDIKHAFDTNKDLSNVLLDPFFKNAVESRIQNYREVVSTCVLSGLPTPSMSAGLAYFDGYTKASLPANLLQAQRDFFGAHTYERIDANRGEFFHTDWTGTGGKTSSTTYNV